MKIAIISDIHGNDEALTAVLNDINTQKCDKMGVCEKNVENMQKLHTKLSPSYPQNVDNFM